MFSSKEIHFRNKKIILGGILILALIVTMNRIPTNDIIKDSVKLEPFPIPRASFSFSNTSITIDEDAVSNTTHSGNWAWAADQPWCTGFGTADQPYVIQDMIFDIPADHSGISIINSHNIFFIIQDCTFENSSTSWTEGVRFENTSNGTISNCVFNHNWHAIYFLSDSDYNNIWNCNVYNSSYNGIEVRTGSDFNNISHNIVNNTTPSGWYGGGIYIRGSSNNIVSYNNCTDNGHGILIYEKSHNNFVHNNICYENQETGLTLRSGDGNIIQNNTMENNGNYGIVLSNYLSLGSHYTTISFNTVNNCPSGGISIYESDNCNIFNNTISNSPANGGIRIILSHRSRVFNNTAFNNQIRVDQASHNQIISNRIEGGTYGIRGYSNSNNNSFFKNEITKVSCGLYLLGGTLANISENLFDDCSIYGIYLTSGNWNSSISRNRIYNSDSGIYSQEGGDYNSYIDNEIYNSSTYGMRIRSSDYLTLSGNSMEKNGLLLEKCVHNSIDSSNTLAGKPIHYYEDQDGLILNGDTSDFAQLYVINSNNTRISNFNFRDLQIGLYVVGGDNVIIENNNISNNDLYGLYVGELNNSIIRGNIANDNEHGIYYSCDDPDDWDEESPDFSLLHHSNTFSQNIANNNKIGFYAYFSLNDVIEENEFSNNSEYGINGKYFYNSSLCGNIVVDNGEYGINLEYTNNTFIEGNQIYSNQIGLKVYESHYAQIIANDIIGNIDYGIFVGNTNFSQTIQNLIMDTNGTGIYFESDSGQNIITDNLFYTNLLHADDNGHDNEWYLENLGNFWDNYTGVDSNNDGIGELPMNITGNAGSSDLYPIFDETIPTIEDATAANITGKLSYMLSWEIGDFYPATYTISLGDEVVVDSTPWSNGTVSYTIPADTLLDGSYFCTIKVVDRFGNNHSSSVLVNVDGTAPTIIHPTNLVMDEETTFILINWTLSDLHPASYSLWLNGTEIVPSTSWTNGNVTYNFTISDLMPGNYTFELRVLDSYGNEVIEEFLIIIADPDDPNVGLIIGIIAGSIVMIGAAIFVIIRKKKA